MKRWLLPFLALAACGRSGDEGPIRVSVIGGPPTLVDPNRKVPDETQRVLLGAVAEGLVGYNESGQVAPALAQRWIVTSDGLSAIFRLRAVAWPDGTEVGTTEVTRRLRAMLAPGSRNPLRTAFDSIEELNPTTPEVIEFRLATPRPPLLELLAQPEAVMLSRSLQGTGRFAVGERGGETVTLDARTPATPETPPSVPYSVRLTGERAAKAIVRFREGAGDLVLGGSYQHWPLLPIADVAENAIRIDPAEGLFGLSVQKTEGFLAEPGNREVLGMAIDRDALLAMFNAPGWPGVLTVLPQRYRSAADPALPLWARFDLAGRIEEARRRVSAWRAANPDAPLRIRLHLPDSPGSTLLFGRLAADWRRVGIETVRSNARDADLRLVDQVAPAGSAVWYLNNVACPAPAACSQEAVTALDAARAAESLVERGTQLALADRAVADSGLWVPLAKPLRWSLVSPRLTLFRENARAWHPLHLLRRPPR
jgi:oligopeptide transport system substrate-binding protein